MTRLLAMLALLVLVASPAAGAPSGNGMIAFASGHTYGDGRVDRGGIYAVTPDGGGRMLVTPGAAAAERPVWSPDGSRLAYLVDEDHDHPSEGSLWVVNADGSGRVLLFAGEAGDQVWSPDGTRIAFRTSSQVHTVRVVDGHVTRVGAGGAPSWSPDGTQLVYADGSGLAIVDAATGTRVRTLELLNASSPVWSPDGMRIAFLQHVFTGSLFASSDLTVIRPDGSGRTTIWERLLSPSALTWSPDGTRLLLGAPAGTSHAGSTTVLRDREVYIASADGSRKTFVTRGRKGFSPAWSPDGTKVAFTTERGVSTQIFIANADGTCHTQLTRSASASPVTDHAHTPSWQPVANAPTSPPIRYADLGLAWSSRGLLGRAGADELLGGAGGDTILPGPGRDAVTAGRGADFILARDGMRDSIKCGLGRDLVLADRRDAVARDCERVSRL